MIFDSDAIAGNVIEWQTSYDVVLLERIIDDSTPLLESIASQFDSNYREDLIQESIVAIIYAIEFYDISIAKLYSYLSAVIRNACVSYMRSATRDPLIPLDANDICAPPQYEDDSDILVGLVAHNRQRFPSLDVESIDAATEYIYYAVRDGVWGKSRGIIAHLVDDGFPRNVATILYHSSIVYLRFLYLDKHGTSVRISKEFSLLPELEKLVGKALYGRILAIMSGMYVKIP